MRGISRHAVHDLAVLLAGTHMLVKPSLSDCREEWNAAGAKMQKVWLADAHNILRLQRERWAEAQVHRAPDGQRTEEPKR
jgi:hypothetical protein